MKPRTQSPCRYLLVGLLLVGVVRFIQSQTLEMSHQEFENSAQDFGQHLYEINKKVTHLEEIEKKYSSVKLVAINAAEMVQEMVRDMETMLQWKIQAVQRITDTVQQRMEDHIFQKDLTFEKFRYYNAKTVNENSSYFPTALDLLLLENQRFNMPVNTTYSTIHVATNVYNEDVYVLNAIKGSEEVNPNFMYNYHKDPTSLWQYFGSVTGFLRNYPGVKWIVDEEKIDTFDCRMRPWYIEAASSAKDIVILFDTSGSMLGFKQEIAKHVLSAILDTLNSNDYVAVYKFANNISNVVKCFEDYLVTANRENVALFKESISNLKGTDFLNQANFSQALITAFELLQKYNDSNEGSQCNQAIMIICDGAPDTYESIFNLYNQPDRYVRVFTYLIGREVTQVEEVQTMACEHRGYYSHVKTLAEIREQVQKYIPVMARPMIMQKMHHFVWTPVYADINDVRYCDTYWDHRYCEENTKYYQFMTTVAAPVFDLKNVTKDPNLLGVAGTDVPTKDIVKLAPPYKLGVNGYSFIITNNGHILIHPDLRPLFADTMKLDYNTIDLSETELSNMDIDPWEKDPEIMLLRQRMVDRETGSMNITVRTHYDDMKRVMPRTNQYFFTPINQTPFSFGVVLPDGYGLFRADTEIKDKSDFRDAMSTLEDANSPSKWKVHPDWVYCIHRFLEINPPNSTESVLFDFLNQFKDDIVNKNFSFQRVLSPFTENYNKNSKEELDYCDFDLIRMLLFDAKATNVYEKKSQSTVNPKERNGVAVAFVSTRSGLTRWEDLLGEEELRNMSQPHFAQLHDRAIDETWYKRAVDQYFVNDTDFVFSVPFNASRGSNNTFVTVSHAVFVKDRKVEIQVPVAVVGLQYEYNFFAEMLMNFTSNCQQGNCTQSCKSDDIDCYLLDDNGFVIFSEEFRDVGKFFGEIDGIIMRSLIIDGIYKGFMIYDFQGMCEERDWSSAASFIQQPFELIMSIVSWFWKKLIVFWIEYNLYNLWSSDWLIFASPFEDSNPGMEVVDGEEYEFYFRSCNKNLTLYRVNTQQLQTKSNQTIQCNPDGCDSEWEQNYKDWLLDPNNTVFLHPKPYSVHRVPYTNLVLIAADATCPCRSSEVVSIAATEMQFVNDTRCHMMRTTLHRKAPATCYNYHPDELNIRECGRGRTLQTSILLIFFGVLLSSTHAYIYRAQEDITF